MIRVMIVEDDGLFRDLLTISLSYLPDMEIVQVVPDGKSAIVKANQLHPDVVLMDIELGTEPNGIDAALAIKEMHPDIGIVILSSHRERKYTNQVLLGEMYGWSYLLKQSVKEIGALARAINGAASGLVVMDPEVINNVKPRKDSMIGSLTPREQEVLDVMAQGYSNTAIAEKLVLNVKSVENYINAIYQELQIVHTGGMHPRVQAVLSYLKSTT
ncbi:MAG: response regulator [Dehalococcoidia bacterium]